MQDAGELPAQRPRIIHFVPDSADDVGSFERSRDRIHIALCHARHRDTGQAGERVADLPFCRALVRIFERDRGRQSVRERRKALGVRRVRRHLGPVVGIGEQQGSFLFTNRECLYVLLLQIFKIRSLDSDREACPLGIAPLGIRRLVGLAARAAIALENTQVERKARIDDRAQRTPIGLGTDVENRLGLYLPTVQVL
jgi:hypothetical protein